MKKKNFRIVFAAAALLGFVLANLTFAQTQPQQPPEYKEVVAASRIQDLAAKIKELERIKAAYPTTQYLSTIDSWILAAKIDLSDSLEAILGLQKEFLTKGKGPDLVQAPYMAADQIVSHPKLKTFDKAKVLAAVLGYKEAVLKAVANPEALQGIPLEQRNSFKTFFSSGIDVLVAQAQLNIGDPAKALASLESYRTVGGTVDGQYSYTKAEALVLQGKTKEAYEAYLLAATENYAKSAEKAKELYVKLNGKADGFDAALEAKLKALPYHPEEFKPEPGWKGKAVLAEIFTGSECPPCVGADLAFDGLIESVPADYLAILEYHLPIPRPDPIMNPATKKRQDYYGVNSTPTIIIDGDKKLVGGGSRGMAEGKYKEYRAGIEARLAAVPTVALKAKASRAGDAVKVEASFDKVVPGAEYYVVLIQREEKYKGSNGIVFHKMVVRDLAVLDPAAPKAVTFDLAASEQATDAYLTDFEKTSTRFQNFKFPERHAKIDRSKLGVVFFAQDKETKKVLNAVVAGVK
jgi:thiol-disulfide isomerase/thioredoxin